MRTQGAPLHVNLSDNTFANGSIALADAGFYIELAGPLHALMTRQSVDRDSLFVHAVDVAQMTLQHHVFGGNFESRAVFVERSNVSLTPPMALLIAHSRFENAHADHEMLRLANIQPMDAIVLGHAHFVHVYVRVGFGAATGATLPDSAALVVRHLSFTQYAEHSTLYIVDEQQALANVMQTVAENNTFTQSGAANCSI